MIITHINVELNVDESLVHRYPNSLLFSLYTVIFLTPLGLDVGAVKDESSECDSSSWMGVGGGSQLAWAVVTVADVRWAKVNAWSILSCSLVGWAGGWICCPSARVHHGAGGWRILRTVILCPSFSFSPWLLTDYAVSVWHQSRTPWLNLLASPARMSLPEVASAKNRAQVTADFTQPFAHVQSFLAMWSLRTTQGKHCF